MVYSILFYKGMHIYPIFGINGIVAYLKRKSLIKFLLISYIGVLNVIF